MNKSGKAIKNLRESLGLSQDKLSEVSGISQSTIGRIESGATAGSIRVLEQIAKKLDKELIIDFIDR